MGKPIVADVKLVALRQTHVVQLERLTGDFIEDKAVVSQSEAAIRLSLNEKMAFVLKTLSSREERIICMRLGFEDGNQRTLEEVGQVFAVTRPAHR